MSIADTDSDTHDATTTTPPTEPLARIWDRLARPFDTPETIDAILGLSPHVVSQYVGALTATSPQAIRLIDAMPRTVRSLATSMDTQAERCRGELRGPVLWSETMSARSASNGMEDLFVCATPTRAYDITENRVLVAALDTVHQASVDARSISAEAYDDEMLRSARKMGDRARSFLLHPSLRGVTHERPSGRAIKRTRSGKSRRSYQPALDMLVRAEEPLDPDLLVPFSDQRTRVQHAVLMALIDRLESDGGRLPDFRSESGALYAGPLQYHHPRKRANVDRISGIVLGSLLIDVPDRIRETNRFRAEEELRVRAHGRETFVVMDAGDVERAFALAVGLAQK